MIESHEDHPYNLISRSQFISEYSEITKNKICWQIGCYLGSMLYIDMGRKVAYTTKLHKRNVEKGTDIIGVRDCYWEIYHDDELIIDAWTDNNIIKEKIRCLINKQFVNVIIDDNWIEFSFSDNYKLICDFTNQNEVEDQEDSILQLTCENGNEYEISVFGNIEKHTLN